jgi:hypothetical protein
LVSKFGIWKLFSAGKKSFVFRGPGIEQDLKNILSVEGLFLDVLGPSISSKPFLF